MSGDPEQEYFSDGITEDIITGLSGFRSLFVIARNSTFTYKGKPVNVTQVAQELGVRYVLEGSVRKAGSRVRISAQLIDAGDGHHLWAERYDRDLDDIFAVQDEITERVVATVIPALDQFEQERAARKPPDSLDAWDCYQRGLWHMNRMRLSEFPAAREYFRQAIRLAPRSPLGYCGLAYLGSGEATIALHGPESDLVKEIDEAARTAVALGPRDQLMIRSRALVVVNPRGKAGSRTAPWTARFSPARFGSLTIAKGKWAALPVPVGLGPRGENPPRSSPITGKSSNPGGLRGSSSNCVALQNRTPGQGRKRIG